MWPFIFVTLCVLMRGNEAVHVFWLWISALPLDIQLPRGVEWGSHLSVYPTILLFLAQLWILISHVTAWFCVVDINCFVMTGDSSFCWYWWNCLPSLFTRFVDIGRIAYHHCLHVLLILVELFIIIVYTFCWYWWNCLPSLFTRFVDIGGIVYHHCLLVLLILVELFTIIVYTFCWYWWNCLPSLFTRFVDIGGIVHHHCLHVLLILVELFTIIVYTFCWYW
jgi:hypothetical protein